MYVRSFYQSTSVFLMSFTAFLKAYDHLRRRITNYIFAADVIEQLMIPDQMSFGIYYTIIGSIYYCTV